MRNYILPVTHQAECLSDRYVTEVTVFWSNLEIAKHAVSLLTDEERMEVFSDYCRGCGTSRLPCYCEVW